MPFDTPSMNVGGDIRPCRFVKQSTAADNTLLEADANEEIFGIATEAAAAAPIPNADGDAGNTDAPQMHYYPPGRECLLELGSGGVTRGGWLKSDNEGCGVAVATTGTTAQFYGAKALESGSAGEFVRVLCWPLPKIYPALS